MPTGGAIKPVRIAAAVLVAVGWIAWIIYRFVQGGPADATTLFPVFVFAQWIGPDDFQRTRACRVMTAVSAAAWWAYIWRFGAADYRQTVILWIVALVALGVGIWLAQLGYRRWKTIADPVTRLSVATIVTTVVVVCSVAGILWALTWAPRSFEGGNIGAGWLLALVLNLPLLALFALGFREQRKRGDGNDA